MSRKYFSSTLLGKCMVITTISAFSTVSGQMNFTNITLPKRGVQGYRNMNISRRTFANSSEGLLFKDYIRKFHPNVVFNRIDARKRANGQNASVDEDFNEIFEGMDATDDLLRLNVESISSGRRQWRPPGVPNFEVHDRKDQFSLRQRIFDLMRHTVYRTRNKLVIMQLLRTKYKHSPLYKMGFLMSRADTACKSFAAYTYRSVHGCISRRYGSNSRFELISMLTAEERLNNKWFEIELLIDLIIKNDDLAKEAVASQEPKGVREKWKFVD